MLLRFRWGEFFFSPARSSFCVLNSDGDDLFVPTLVAKLDYTIKVLFYFSTMIYLDRPFFMDRQITSSLSLRPLQFCAQTQNPSLHSDPTPPTSPWTPPATERQARPGRSLLQWRRPPRGRRRGRGRSAPRRRPRPRRAASSSRVSSLTPPIPSFLREFRHCFGSFG